MVGTYCLASQWSQVLSSLVLLLILLETGKALPLVRGWRTVKWIVLLVSSVSLVSTPVISRYQSRCQKLDHILDEVMDRVAIPQRLSASRLLA
jgi:hypothetical protein